MRNTLIRVSIGEFRKVRVLRTGGSIPLMSSTFAGTVISSRPYLLSQEFGVAAIAIKSTETMEVRLSRG
jgi:hypothetical protein